MRYKTFGKTGECISLLGGGLLRLPLNSSDNSDVNIEEAVKLIRYAIDNGINYFDTAYPYHGFNSERVLGMALTDGYREKVYIATKSPVRYIKKEEDWEFFLNAQLEKLNTGHIDFYALHGIDAKLYAFMKKLNFWEKAMKAKAEGKIKYFGFSFHDTYETFQMILDDYEWDFCQIQLNYADYNFQAGLKGLELARKKGIGIVIMEPLKGGLLTELLPITLLEKLKLSNPDKTPAQWAFEWLLNLDGISVILSGISEMNQLIENIGIFSSEQYITSAMSESDLRLLKNIADNWSEYVLVGCSDCKYCMPCPHGVDISTNFKCYNLYSSKNEIGLKRALHEYGFSLYKNKTGADKCASCGVCEEKCPQNIKIIEKLEQLHKTLHTTENKFF